MTRDQAIAHFGSQAALARALGITRGSVHNWRVVPIGRQYQIELLTDGALRADCPAAMLRETSKREAA